ncbi:hypothetical protein GGI19_005028 [Coemansia pectinata]|uniref:C2 domain-containing protein n=1 Tax=Coemansia pectinata TaxID=1052879 RepID=A0A9W8L8U2_9FUNG|nr:hypothetical protein GGI19_005028 [Coemansia pectinata]
MVAFLYYIPILKTILSWDYSIVIRPIFNGWDDFLYRNYRLTGCFGPKWCSHAKDLGGVLCLEILKGRDIPRKHLLSTFSQYIHIRVGRSSDYSSTVVNSDNEPRFRTKSYFTQDLYTNTLVEISLINDGLYKDTVVGRVSIPVKELYDVRSYHGWLALTDGAGDAAGFVYLASKYRMEDDGEYELLKDEADMALDRDVGDQRVRQERGRSQNRIKVRALLTSTFLEPSTGTSGTNRHINNNDVALDIGNTTSHRF